MYKIYIAFFYVLEIQNQESFVSNINKRKNIMKIFKLLSITTCAVILLSCGNSKQSSDEDTSATSYKPLLERNAKLTNSPEWNKKQNDVDLLFKKIKLNQNDHKSKLMLAKHYMNEARITGEHPYYYPAALTILNDVLEADESNFQAMALKASVMLSLHHFQEAKELGEKAVILNSNNAFIYGVLVDANVELGNYEEAVILSDKMQSIRPGLESYARVSYLREIYGDIPGSIEAMKLAYKSSMAGTEQAAWVGNTLTELYIKEKKYDDARALSNLILEQRPSYAFSIDALGQIHYAKGNYDSAIMMYEKAIDMMPEFSFYTHLAEAKLAIGDDKEAQKIYKDVIPMLEEDAESGHFMDLELASIYLKTGNKNKAMEHAEIAYNRRPQNIDVNKRMAEVLMANGETEKAKVYLKEANKMFKRS